MNLFRRQGKCFDLICRSYRNYLYGNAFADFSIVLLIFLISLFIFKQYIFYGVPFLPPAVSDLIRANLPTYMLLFDIISQGGFFWSWSMGLGTNIFAHADVYFDPFTYITLLGGRDHIADLMIWSFVLKHICSGIAFSYYVRHFRLQQSAIIAGAVLYAFCGYSMIMGANLALGTIMVYFPLLLLAIEDCLGKGRIYAPCCILFLIGVYSYYFFYICVVLSIGYIVIRCSMQEQSTLFVLMKFAGCVLVSFLLAAPVILPQAYLVLSNSRLHDGKEVIWSWRLFKLSGNVLASTIARCFSLNILGDSIKNAYYGACNYFECELYVTSLSILAYFQLLYYEPRWRKRILLITALFLGMISIPFFSYVLNAFAAIRYRWFFVIHLFIAMMCSYALDRINLHRHIHIKMLLFSQFFAEKLLIISVGVVFYRSPLGIDGVFKALWSARKYFAVLVLIYGATVLGAVLYNYIHRNSSMWSEKYMPLRKGAFMVFLFAFILGESYVNYHTWYRSECGIWKFPAETRYGYDDESVVVLNRIRMKDASFFRIYKSFDSVYDLSGIPSNNDALCQQYFGLKNYCSLNHPSYIEFLHACGVYTVCPVERESFIQKGFAPYEAKGSHLNYINGIDAQYSLLTYLGVKYYLCKSSEMDIIPYPFVYSSMENRCAVFLNSNCFPLGFINEKVMAYDDFKLLPYQERVTALLDYTILDNPDISQLSVNANLGGAEDLSSSVCQLVKFSADHLWFEVFASHQKQYISFSIPYDAGWHIYIDGKETSSEKINISLLGVQISQGKHSVELIFIPPGLYNGILLFVLGIFIFIFWNKHMLKEV